MSDRIVLKDGTIEESDKIWTSDKFVHFILKGTQSVEIRYAKDIVDRVERDGDVVHRAFPAPSITDGRKTVADVSGNDLSRDSEAEKNGSRTPNRGGYTIELKKVEQENKGTSFYDPRRTPRYKVNRTSAHNDLQSALNELAKIYGRTPDWVMTYMGEENDIQIIHQNLIGRRNVELASQKLNNKLLPTVDTAGGTTAPAPATENLSSIRTPSNPLDDPDLRNYKGIKFYDPRRKRKYWTGRSNHHGSLKEALIHLARQYNVTPKWIEDHMGGSNLLIEIHQSIQSSLPRQ